MNVTEIRNQVKHCIDHLSPEKLVLAADFLSNLAKQESEKGTKDVLEERLTSVDNLERRKASISNLQGKYAHAPTSSDDFAQQKQKEID